MANGQILSFTRQYNIPGETTTFTVVVKNNTISEQNYTLDVGDYGLVYSVYPSCNIYTSRYFGGFNLYPDHTKTITFTIGYITYGWWLATLHTSLGDATFSSNFDSPTVNTHTTIDYYNPSEPSKNCILESGYGYIDETTHEFTFRKSTTKPITLTSGDTSIFTINTIYDEPYGNTVMCYSGSPVDCSGCGGYKPIPQDKFYIASILRDAYDFDTIIDMMIVDENLNVVTSLGLNIIGVNSMMR